MPKTHDISPLTSTQLIRYSMALGYVYCFCDQHSSQIVAEKPTEVAMDFAVRWTDFDGRSCGTMAEEWQRYQNDLWILHKLSAAELVIVDRMADA
jgi:hypothetical protein